MRLRPIIGWAVFFFLFAIIARAVPSPTAAFHFFNAKRLANAGNYEAAVSAYKRAVETNPKFARAYVELGSLYVVLKNYDAAEDAFKRAMDAEQDSCAACGLGMVYRLEGKDDQAEAILRKSIDLNRADSCPYNELGRLYYGQKKYLKAAEAFDQEIKIRPTAVSLHFLANCVYYSGREKESIQFYQKAIRLNRKYTPVYNDLARAYNVTGRHVDALNTYLTALTFDPDNTITHAGIGFTQLMSGNIDEAYRQYEVVRKSDAELADQLWAEIKRRTPPDFLPQKERPDQRTSNRYL